MKLKSLLALLAASMLFMAGCGDDPKPEEEPVVTEEDTAAPQEEGNVDEKIDETASDEEGTSESRDVTVEDEGTVEPDGELYKANFVENGANSYNEMLIEIDGQQVLVKLPIVFFSFDKYNLSASAQEKISDFAQYAKDNNLGGKTIHIGGHCDEWGSDEYNFALALKRAKSVENALKADGVDLKVTMTSFGESKPLCTEHTKECWTKNRRSEVKILP